jgi:hypothetical protein
MGEKPNFFPFAGTDLPRSDSPRGLFFGLVFMKGFSVYVESVDREWLWPSCEWSWLLAYGDRTGGFSSPFVSDLCGRWPPADRGWLLGGEAPLA